MTDHTTDGVSRRDLIKTIAVAGAGMGLAHLGLPGGAGAEPVRLVHEEPRPTAAATMMGVKFEPRDIVRIAIVGTGLRGRSTLNELLGVGNVKITALCDIVPDKVEKAKAEMKKAGHDYEPAVYTGGERD
ncbi:MAG: hypothetical protein JWL61_1403, partial [Gemmatimonadetes bacterium]|nr:hypothetical protein [Gemmatimonadota bacterium]